MEGLICFFTSRVRGHTSSGNTLLARNAKLRQDFFFENLRNFSPGATPSLIRPDKTQDKWHSFAVERRRGRLAAAGVTGSSGVQEVRHELH